MKKTILSLGLLFALSVGLLAQQTTRYQYVIIPIKFPAITKDLNPYGVSSDILKDLTKKGIKCYFEGNELPEDRSVGLTVDLENTSSFFSSSLKLSLLNNNGDVEWEGKGKGTSKDYVSGYAEAVTAALASLEGLPTLPANTKATLTSATSQPDPARVRQIEPSPTQQGSGATYQAHNMYFNDTYMVDVIDSTNGTKQLIIINGKILGYSEHQTIGTLTPSGIDDAYLVSWKNRTGENVSGMAKLSDNKLMISLQNHGVNTVIELLKP